jgi:predicted dehydrogenase
MGDIVIKICVVGAGGHSRGNHGPSLQRFTEQNPGVIELAAIADLDRDRAESYARDYGFKKTYLDFHKMIDEIAPDAIVVVTPVTLTAQIVGELLPYRVPLLIEKPPGLSARETADLLHRSESSQTPVMVSFNRRFNPALALWHEWAAEHQVSLPSLVLARMFRVNRLEPEFIVGTGIHLIDTVLSLLGSASLVSSRRWDTASGGKCCTAHIENEKQQSAEIAIMPDTGVNEETYEIFGPDYAARIDTARSSIRISRKGDVVLEKTFGHESPFIAGGAFGETASFINAVRKKVEFSPDLSDGLLSMQTAESIEKGGTL